MNIFNCYQFQIDIHKHMISHINANESNDIVAIMKYLRRIFKVVFKWCQRQAKKERESERERYMKIEILRKHVNKGM